MTDTSLDISVRSFKRVQLIHIAGRVDSNTAPEMDQTLKELMKKGNYNLVVELSGINYLSSAGLRALVSALRECKKWRGDVCLVNPSERVLEVLKLAGLDTLFTIYDNETEAVASF
jgi:anti-sigma B factor antagonist